MKELIIDRLGSNQRLDKYLAKYLSAANKSFIYKMLRKKNITLNDKKADGSEKLQSGDSVKIFFSDETLDKFSEGKSCISNAGSRQTNNMTDKAADNTANEPAVKTDGKYTDSTADKYSYTASKKGLSVDYEKIYLSRYKLLRKAYEKADLKTDPDYAEFLKEEKDWLQDYCLFMAIKNDQKGICWIDWPEELKDRHSKAVKEAEKELAEEIEFYRFQQYCFTTQWRKLKAYANKKDISIIGDVPIYVALDSSDAWANPEMLQFDEDYDPKAVAGCPPDAFSATGQLWGNPLYDWKALKKDGYGWWVQRMTHCLELYDVVRIDHFRGFDEYYAIPYGDKTAERGKWEKGPGMNLFHTLDKKIKDLRVIAEDLGFLTESVLEMLKESGYPGMKVLQFAFDGSEDSSYLPYKYDHNCVVYTGTHDNETTKGWLENLQGHDLKFVREYINCYEPPVSDCVWALIRTALSSVADLAVIPIQDYLCLGNEARMNAPSTLGDNWKWRLTANQISETTLYHMREVTRIYGRLAKVSEEKETDEIANAEEEERQDNDQNSKIVE